MLSERCLDKLFMQTKGKVSWFGGPQDGGVGPLEGLGLVEPADLSSWWWQYLFNPEAEPGETGLARRLNPHGYYIAMRWDYGQTSKGSLRSAFVRVTNPANNKTLLARPVDWGPNVATGRTADLSPGALSTLGLETDSEALFELILL